MRGRDRQIRQILELNDELDELDRLIEQEFRQHHQADIITSMPGFGQRLGAEFIAATGGDVAALGSADRLAAFAGLAPAPRDSGGSAAISAVRSGSTDAC